MPLSCYNALNCIAVFLSGPLPLLRQGLSAAGSGYSEPGHFGSHRIPSNKAHASSFIFRHSFFKMQELQGAICSDDARCRHLADLLDMPKEFRPHVSDYEMKNLFEIAFLAPEQVRLFQSDFRYVADYLVQKRKTNRYVPSPDVIQHVDATLKLLSVLTNDIRFETVAKSLDREKKGAITMCTIVDQFEEKGRAEGFVQGKLQGIEQGERQGIVQGKLEGMTQVYYTKLHYSAEQIARELGAPVAQIERLIRQLQI